VQRRIHFYQTGTPSISGRIMNSLMRVAACGIFLALCLFCGRPGWCQDQVPAAKNADAEKIQREQLLAQMRKRAEGTQAFRPRVDDKKPIEMVAEPLVRYSDSPREIADATLWAIGGGGRPAAILKVEAYHRKEGKLAWLYSLGSLDDEVIRVEWGDGHRWAAKQPGLDWKQLPAGPAPADTARGRLSQMKELIRRFEIAADEPGRGKEKQRLFPRPLHRYADEKADVVDGAVFGFTTYGTNPSALVLLELWKGGKQPPAWHYAASRFTDAALVMSLDEKRVWSVEGTSGGPVELDTWLYFWEATEPTGDR
jgi:hypothetical protein